MNKKNEILFYLGIVIILIQIIANCTSIFNLTSIQQIIIQISAVLLLGVRIIWEGVSLKEGGIKLIILIATFMNYRICNDDSIFITAIIIMASKNMNIDQIIKFIATVMSTFLGILISIYAVEYFFDVENLELIIRATATGRSIRHSFYYLHPNVFSEHITWTLFMWLYLKKSRLKFSNYIVIILMAIFIYYFPNSRTNSLILILFIFIDLIYYKYNGRIIKFFQANIFNICFVISFVLLFLCTSDNIIVNNINSMFSGRIKLGWYTNELFGMKILGQSLPIGANIKITQYEWIMGYALDNFYYRIVYSNGLLISFFYTIFINKRLKLLVEKENVKELIFFTILCIFGLSEIVMLNIIIAFPLLTINNFYNTIRKENNISE